ncbi:DUF262 domain-containing protein [uncultured Pseudokineococcus sp.]|uniref:GmrSD restriction endonuclease domain-containing protein n=1 Tax=uncultured Pseudokineococcus sp. TaxID=1642928 RepID=UPI00343F2D49
MVQLLVSVLRGHPLGVVMTLETGGHFVRFKPTPIAGVGAADLDDPDSLLLDGQQRLTSLFQSLDGAGVVDTVDARGKKMRRRYFVDVEACADGVDSGEKVVLSLPEDGVERESFGRPSGLDLSTPERQYAEGKMPVTALFAPSGAMTWLFDYNSAAGDDANLERSAVSKGFNQHVLLPLSGYQIPMIRLDKTTTKEAVATVFEKVNTGGLPLDVFELLTATFAGDAAYYQQHARDFRLGDDWALFQAVIDSHPVLADVRKSDILQALTLLATADARKRYSGAGKAPATSARRESVLGLELDQYLRWAPEVRQALHWVAAFLHAQSIHTATSLPYRTQVVPLLVLRVLLGDDITKHAVSQRVQRWYWCGVLGERYGGTTETKFALDVEQVPGWASQRSPLGMLKNPRPSRKRPSSRAVCCPSAPAARPPTKAPTRCWSPAVRRTGLRTPSSTMRPTRPCRSTSTTSSPVPGASSRALTPSGGRASSTRRRCPNTPTRRSAAPRPPRT